MTQRQYFQVVESGSGGELPDPAIYCPANGYIPDPTNYVPMSEIANMPPTQDREIQLLCTDQGTKHISFYTNVNNSGKVRIIVYGNNDTIITNALVNNATNFNYDFPIGFGIPKGDYSVYRVSIMPELSANNITNFYFQTNSIYLDNGWRIIAAKFKTPNLISLQNLFQNNWYIIDIEFVGPFNSVTTAASVAKGCPSLRSVIMPSSMNLCTSLDSSFSTSPILIRLTLPDSLPALTTMYCMLERGGLTSFTFPTYTPVLINISSFAIYNTTIKRLVLHDSYPLLTNISQIAYNCTNLESVQLPMSMPKMQNLTNLLSGCSKLEGEINLPEMPLVTNISNIISYCPKIKKLTFIGAMNLCTTLYSLATGCYEITEITMPSSMTGLSGTSATFYAFNNCYRLKKITLPTAMEFTSGTWDSVILSSFQYLVDLETLTTCASWPAKLFTFQFPYSTKLTSFHQPTLRVYNLNLGCNNPTPPTGTYWPLNHVEIDWQNVFSGTTSQLPNITINYCAIDVTEYIRILTALPERPANFSYASLYTNVCLCSASFLAIVFYGFIDNDTRKWRYSYGIPVSSIEVGMYLFYNDVKFTQRAGTVSGGVITKVGHNMPDGTKVSFRSLTGVSGVDINREYFLVNSTTDTWQVSQTEGGAAIAITGSGSCVYSAFPKVEEIGVNWVRVTFQNENPIATNNFTTFFSWYRRDIGTHKGWGIF